MMILILKSLILINFVKKNRLAAGPLPGVTLGGGYAAARGPNGAENIGKNLEKYIETSSKIEFYPHQLFSEYPLGPYTCVPQNVPLASPCHFTLTDKLSKNTVKINTFVRQYNTHIR